MKMKRTLLIIISVFIALVAGAQNNKNLAELLGYPKDSKLLIIHADDIGLSQSTNAAVIKAFDARGITSGSIMMPCPWAPDIAAYFREHPGLDIGIHLTMTAEWEHYKWGGITSSSLIPSLLDKNGYFYPGVEDLAKTGKGIDAEKELRAQIDKAISLGINPTHLDTHMGSVMANGELLQVYLKLSEIYHLPVLFPRSYIGMLPPDIAKKFEGSIFLLDNLFMLEPQMIGPKWIDAYSKGISELKPGLNQMIVHLAVDNDETRAICRNHPDYGSEWRQKDLDLVLGNELKDKLKEANVILITWKQIRDLMNTTDKNQKLENQ
jgi:chitin disaccharide deacetylase